ncbi:MAG: MlaC/ttg2D family ABC transporter substrate-binding protein [Candidatus Binatia bacterium]
MNPTVKRQRKLGESCAFNGAMLALLMGVWLPASIFAGEPTDQLRATVNSIRTALKGNPGSESSMRVRRDQIRRLIDSRFDFSEIARRSLGSHWKSLSPHEQHEFVEAFKGLLEMAYVALIESQGGGKILYQREAREAESAQVNTTIVTRKGEGFSVDYRMRLLDGAWKIYDVVIGNISVVNNYRSQFSRVIAKSSYGELLDKLKEKQSQASVMKWGGKEQSVSARKNMLDESTPLIIIGLIGASNDGQFFPGSSR